MIAPLDTPRHEEPAHGDGGTIVSQEDIIGVQRPPSAAERQVIAAYRARYRATFGFDPWGLHYIDGLADHGPVFLPPTAPSPSDLPTREM